MYGIMRLYRWFNCTPILTIILDLLHCDHLRNERHGYTYIVGHCCTQYHVLGEEPFAIMCDSLILTIPIIFFFLTRNNPFLDPNPVHTSKSNWPEEIGDSWWWGSGGLCSDHSVGAWETTFYVYTTQLSFRLLQHQHWFFSRTYYNNCSYI